MTDEDKPLIGWAQIGKYYGKSCNTIRRWHKQRPLPVKYLPGGSPFLYVEDLREWEKGCTKTDDE